VLLFGFVTIQVIEFGQFAAARTGVRLAVGEIQVQPVGIVVFWVTLAGQTITGAVEAFTVIVKEQVAVFPA
jgi:hypothetical protein